MRFIAGSISALMVFSTLAYYKCSASSSKPPPEFLNAEMANADDEHTGSCFSVGVVITANYALRRAGVKTWQSLDNNRWRFQMENMESGPGGPQHAFESITFELHGDRAWPIAYANSQSNDAPLASGVIQLLEAPKQYRSVKVARCRTNAAQPAVG